jgi:RNA polymerase sigma factor (sigma-70 family)
MKTQYFLEYNKHPKTKTTFKIAVSRNIYLCGKQFEWREEKREQRAAERNSTPLSLETLIEIGYEAVETENLENFIEKEMQKEQLRKAVAELPEDEQNLIWLAYSDMTDGKVAEMLGLKRKTFTYRRDKIIVKLRKAMAA